MTLDPKNFGIQVEEGHNPVKCMEYRECPRGINQFKGPARQDTEIYEPQDLLLRIKEVQFRTQTKMMRHRLVLP